MIKLFRHIRRSLLKENKMGKYFKYAIVEILLVVIGILIALSINNWNETRKEQALELDYLIGIKTDLEDDLPNIERRINVILSRISALHKIDSTFARGIETHDISLDTIKLTWMFNRGQFNRLTMGSYTALTTNASAGLIQNTELLQSIQNLYESRYPGSLSVYEDLKRREEYVGWKYAKEIKSSTIQAFFIDNLNHDEVLADFNFYYRQKGLMYNHLNRQLDDMQKIIDDINTELNNRK
mgnify:CR=1 FL=1